MLALKHRANGDTTPPERSHPDEIIQAVAGAPQQFEEAGV